jgi:hypothetical protein
MSAPALGWALRAQSWWWLPPSGSVRGSAWVRLARTLPLVQRGRARTGRARAGVAPYGADVPESVCAGATAMSLEQAATASEASLSGTVGQPVVPAGRLNVAGSIGPFANTAGPQPASGADAFPGIEAQAARLAGWLRVGMSSESALPLLVEHADVAIPEPLPSTVGQELLWLGSFTTVCPEPTRSIVTSVPHKLPAVAGFAVLETHGARPEDEGSPARADPSCSDNAARRIRPAAAAEAARSRRANWLIVLVTSRTVSAETVHETRRARPECRSPFDCGAAVASVWRLMPAA